MSTDFHYCIVGGGVIGLALAYQLSQHSQVLLIERHSCWGNETSSRNSEVIHAGLYYPTGSLKEQLCLRGKELLYDFCQRFSVAHRQTGKLIVAQQINDPRLERLYTKACQLGVAAERLNQQQLQQREPMVRGQQALFSPTTGIIDSHQFLQTLAHQAERHGATLVQQTTLSCARFHPSRSKESHWQIEMDTADGRSEIRSHFLINAAGLQAQQVARSCALAPRQIPPIYPCRGHYFSYQGKSPFRHLVYPLPEENLAGLGIHATVDMGNQLRFGPDTQYLPPGNLDDYQVDPSLTDKFATAIRNYFPDLQPDKLQPAYSGIRPKLHPQHQSSADFVIDYQQEQQNVNLYGIESPGLTASLAIAEYVERQIQEKRGTIRGTD